MLSVISVFVLAFVSAHAFTASQINFQRETLAHHNTLRARHCAQPLQLDDNLNRRAQAYAEKLAATNSFQHSNNGYGENLYMMTNSVPMTSVPGKTATQWWYDEIKFYNYQKPGFTMETGHFTQVVWKGSQKLGVGIAFSNGGRAAYVVANYDPPGNYMGQFDQHVSKASC